MASYEEVLHLLRYRNWHTRSLLDRKFKLVCSELNGRYVSNEFQVEVSAGLGCTGPAARGRASPTALRLADTKFSSIRGGCSLGSSWGGLPFLAEGLLQVRPAGVWGDRFCLGGLRLQGSAPLLPPASA